MKVTLHSTPKTDGRKKVQEKLNHKASHESIFQSEMQADTMDSVEKYMDVDKGTQVCILLKEKEKKPWEF